MDVVHLKLDKIGMNPEVGLELVGRMGKNPKRLIHSHIELTILLMILLLGLILRVYDLGNESLWLDEGFSIKFAKLSLSQIFFLQENSPPLYYVILHFWINWFGDSEFSVRLPSAIFGFLSLFPMYAIGKHIFNREVGMLGLLLLSLSKFHIHYSQEARTYSLTVLLTLLCIYFFLKLLKEINYAIIFGYILFSTLLIYSHIYGLFILIFQNIYIAALSLFSKEDYELKPSRWILIQIVIILLFAPWVDIFINRIVAIQNSFWIATPSLSSIKRSFIAYSGSQSLLYLYMLIFLFSICQFEKISGNIKWVSIFQSIKSYQWKLRLLNPEKISLLLVWLLTPILLPFIISQFSTPIYHTKYTIIASLAFYLFVAKGINTIKHRYLKAAIMGLIIAFSLVGIRGYFTKIMNEQWRDVAKYIDTHAAGNDIILFYPDIQDIIFNYYSKRTELAQKGFRQDNQNYLKELYPTVNSYKRVWVVIRYPTDNKELVVQKLIENYNLSFQQQYEGIHLLLFENGEPL